MNRFFAEENEADARRRYESRMTFVTDDTSIHRARGLDPDDKAILESVKTGEGLITIKSIEEFQELAQAANKCLRSNEGYVLRGWLRSLGRSDCNPLWFYAAEPGQACIVTPLANW